MRPEPSLADELRRLTEMLTGSMPSGLVASGLTTPEDRAMWSGTTSPVLAQSFEPHRSGLLVPSAAARGPLSCRDDLDVPSRAGHACMRGLAGRKRSWRLPSASAAGRRDASWTA